MVSAGGASCTSLEVEGAAGRSAPRSGATEPVPRDRLGYVCIPAHFEVYQHGFSQKPAVRPKSFCPVTGFPIFGEMPRSRGSIGAKRGAIKTMTHGAARRMREDILKRVVVDAYIYDVTITVPGEWPLEVWRQREKCFVTQLVRAGMAGWIRREMQERGQPHAHFLIYVPRSVCELVRNKVLYQGWWNLLDDEQRAMPGAWERANVVKGPFEDGKDAPEWREYLCAHTTKRKAKQACYVGKQWGRFGSNLLEGRATLWCGDLEPEQTKHFTRLLGRWIFSKRKAKRNSLLRRGKKCRKAVRRPPMRIDARRIRFMPGDLVVRMIQWVKR